MSRPLSKNNHGELPRRIIGIAGKKSSGKDASARFIAGINLVVHNYIDEFHSLIDGSLEIKGKKFNDVNLIAPNFCRVYHFADYLKQICHDLFGIDYTHLNVNKTNVTKMMWSSLPGVVTNREVFMSVQKFLEKKQELIGPHYTIPIIFHEEGWVTVRDFLQYLGTNIFRKISSNCWINALKNKMEQDNVPLSIIADARFINELDFIKSSGGLCIKLTRGISDDQHPSENDFLLFDKWDAVIDNKECTNVRCLNRVLYEGLQPLGVFDIL